jgi:hypothetical protein
LRLAFWLGVLCLLLPSGGSQTSSPGTQVSARQALTVASAAIIDMRGFCDRQPQACKAGGEMASALGRRAEAGARTIFHFVTARLSEKPRPAAPSTTVASQNPAAKVVTVSSGHHGTLQPSDLKPAWHGPVPLPPRRQVASARPSV